MLSVVGTQATWPRERKRVSLPEEEEYKPVLHLTIIPAKKTMYLFQITACTPNR